MTARHKKPKELTPMQRRALKAGAMAPVSAGFLLAAASGAFADGCPASQTQQWTQATQQYQQGTQQQYQQGAQQQYQQGAQQQYQQGTQFVSDVINALGQREWHGRRGNWQGDWRLDDNGHWHGQWTPIQNTTTTPVQNTNTTPQGDQRQSTPTHTAPQSGRHHAAPTSAAVQQILQLVNKQRAAAGLHPLTLNARLSKAAQAHSDEMARTGLYSHTGPDGSSPGDRIQRSGYRWSMWAENIHHRTGSPEAIMADWMHSPNHRANILNPNLREIGIGIDSGRSYWTQDFGTSS